MKKTMLDGCQFEQVGNYVLDYVRLYQVMSTMSDGWKFQKLGNDTNCDYDRLCQTMSVDVYHVHMSDGWKFKLVGNDMTDYIGLCQVLSTLSDGWKFEQVDYNRTNYDYDRLFLIMSDDLDYFRRMDV